jgi:DNA-binding LacI/PurR family transcriptional regulator
LIVRDDSQVMEKPRMVTMQDVADAVGLTRAAVSLALRKHPSIPARTQVRVAEAANRLGYRANPLVAALMSYHLRIRSGDPDLTLAYVTSHPPDDPWRGYSAYVQMFEGASRRAEELGCRLEEFSLSQERMSPGRMRDVLRARGIAGLLVAPLPREQTVFPLDITDFAAVGLGFSVAEPVIMRVACDLYPLARMVVERCAEIGYRRIGFAVSREMSARLEHRLLAGFRQGLADAGLEEVVAPLMPSRTATFASFVGDWCRREKPDVVIFGTFDRHCLRALPLEVGCVLSSTDEDGGAMSGAYQNLRGIGAIAVEQLLAQLQHNVTGRLDEPRDYLLRARWVAGRSAPGPGRRRPRRLSGKLDFTGQATPGSGVRAARSTIAPA